jgi:phosphate transport system substrate-binding protein
MLDLHLKTEENAMKPSPSPSSAPRSQAGLVSGLMLTGLLALAGPCLGQGKVVVGGAGSMLPMMQELARAYEAKKGPQGIEFMTNSLGSGGGIKGVEAGRLAIGLTGRPLKDNEKGAVVYRQLAVMPVVIAASSSLPVSGLTAAQLCGIYSGAIKSWKQVGGADVAIVPLTRN